MTHKHCNTMLLDHITHKALAENIGEFCSAEGASHEHVFFV